MSNVVQIKNTIEDKTLLVECVTCEGFGEYEGPGDHYGADGSWGEPGEVEVCEACMGHGQIEVTVEVEFKTAADRMAA